MKQPNLVKIISAIIIALVFSLSLPISSKKVFAHQNGPNVPDRCNHPSGEYIGCYSDNYCDGTTKRNDEEVCFYTGAEQFPIDYANHSGCYTVYGITHLADAAQCIPPPPPPPVGCQCQYTENCPTPGETKTCSGVCIDKSKPCSFNNNCGWDSSGGCLPNCSACSSVGVTPGVTPVPTSPPGDRINCWADPNPINLGQSTNIYVEEKPATNDISCYYGVCWGETQPPYTDTCFLPACVSWDGLEREPIKVSIFKDPTICNDEGGEGTLIARCGVCGFGPGSQVHSCPFTPITAGNYCAKVYYGGHQDAGCWDNEDWHRCPFAVLPPPTPSGTIVCNPSTFVLPNPDDGTGTSVITSNWQNFISGSPSADICVSQDGGVQTLFAAGGGPSGSNTSNATWIQANHSYKFTLFNLPTNASPRCSGTAISSCTVSASAPSCDSVTLSPGAINNLLIGQTSPLIATEVINVRNGTINNVSFVVTPITAPPAVSVSPSSDSTPNPYSTTVTSLAVGSATITASAHLNDINGFNDGQPDCTGVVSVTVVPPPAWFQVDSGDVYVHGSLFSPLPAVTNFSLSSFGSPGVIAANGPTSFASGSVSQSPPWGWILAGPPAGGAAYSYDNYPTTRYDYAYFENKIGTFTTPSDCPASGNCNLDKEPNQSGNYKVDGDLTVTKNWTIGNKQIVILVKGDLKVLKKVNINNPSGFLAFIVQENILIDPDVGDVNPTVKVLQGVYIANGQIRTGTQGPVPAGDKLLRAAGVFIAHGGFSLQRENANIVNSPAELFTYDLDILMSAPREFFKTDIIWEEVLP